jgi:hypothetical protein
VIRSHARRWQRDKQARVPADNPGDVDEALGVSLGQTDVLYATRGPPQEADSSSVSLSLVQPAVGTSASSQEHVALASLHVQQAWINVVPSNDLDKCLVHFLIIRYCIREQSIERIVAAPTGFGR